MPRLPQPPRDRSEASPKDAQGDALAETLPPRGADDALAKTLLPDAGSDALGETLAPRDVGGGAESLAQTLPAAPPPLGAKGTMALDDTLLPPGSGSRQGESPLAVLLGVGDTVLGAQAQEASGAEVEGASTGSARPRRQGTLGSAKDSDGLAASCAEESVERLVGYARRYEERQELGRGGLGRVYLAQDRQLGREVAIKELHRRLASARGPGAPDSSLGSRNPMEVRFLDEARVTAQLEHPGIPPVYELGQREDGSIYYAMRRIRGRTLSEAIRGRELPERLELVPHFLELCQAVAYAHSRGVIHRDLKTENVMLGDFGETLVLDWGLAKVKGKADRRLGALAEGIEGLRNADVAETLPEGPTQGGTEDVEQLRTGDAMMTMAGQALGTPAYMPPEQARGDLAAIDERSDVYSLGAILYEILTGRPPHQGPTVHAVLLRVMNEDVRPPQTLVPEVPEELAAIAQRALARDPEVRYPSAWELAEDVRRFQVGGLVRAHQYSAWALFGRWLRRHRAALVAVLALVAVASGAWWYRGWSSERARQAAEKRRQAEVVSEVRGLIAEVAVGPTDKNWLEVYTFKLISLGEPAVQDALGEALAHPEDRVRRVVSRSLGGMKSRRAVPALLARLEPGVEASEVVLADVVNALGIIGDPRADRPVDAVRWRHGQHGWLWKETALAYQMIPPAPLPPRPTYDQLVDRGRSLVNKERVAEGIPFFDRAIAKEPKNTRALVNRAVAFQRVGKLELALADLNAVLDINPGEVKAKHNRAILYRLLKKYPEALRDLDAVVASGEIPIIALRNRARVHEAMGNLAQAERDLRETLRRDPRHVSSRVSLATLLRRQGRHTEALGELDRALTDQPRYVNALSQRATLRLHLSGPSGALADAEALIAIDPSYPWGFRNRALVRASRRDWAGAERDFGEALKLEPSSAETLVERAIWLHLPQGNGASAEADLAAALALTKTKGPGGEIDYAIYRINVLLRLGRREKARLALGELLASARSGKSRAVGFLAGRRTLHELEKSLRPGPHLSHHLHYYQGLKSELEGDLTAALAAYRQVPEDWLEARFVSSLARQSAAAIASEGLAPAP